MDRLNVFLTAIEADSRRDIAGLEAQISESKTALEAESMQRAAADAALWLRGELDRLHSETQLQLAAGQAEHRRALLARREECAEEVFEAVREKIRAFTASAEYPAQMEKLLKEAKAALGDGETVLSLRREDMALGEKLKKLVPAMRVEEGDFALGGLQLSVGARRADLSFDTALRELRGRFALISGLEMRA